MQWTFFRLSLLVNVSCLKVFLDLDLESRSCKQTRSCKQSHEIHEISYCSLASIAWMTQLASTVRAFQLWYCAWFFWMTLTLGLRDILAWKCFFRSKMAYGHLSIYFWLCFIYSCVDFRASFFLHSSKWQKRENHCVELGH